MPKRKPTRKDFDRVLDKIPDVPDVFEEPGKGEPVATFLLDEMAMLRKQLAKARGKVTELELRIAAGDYAIRYYSRKQALARMKKP